MTRLIDVDELYKLINEALTEDVAPRAEVAREIIAEINNAIDEIDYDLEYDEYYGASVVLGRIDTVLEDIEKKYTEGGK